MDAKKIVSELMDELDAIDQAILALERTHPVAAA